MSLCRAALLWDALGFIRSVPVWVAALRLSIGTAMAANAANGPADSYIDTLDRDDYTTSRRLPDVLGLMWLIQCAREL